MAKTKKPTKATGNKKKVASKTKKTTPKKVGVKKAKPTKAKNKVSKIVKKPVKTKKPSVREQILAKIKHLDKPIQTMIKSLPEAISSKFEQVILNGKDILTFGPFKGKSFNSMLKNKKHLSFYAGKFLVASNDQKFVQNVAQQFIGITPSPEMELPPYDIAVRQDDIN